MFTVAQELAASLYGDRRRCVPNDDAVRAFGRLIMPILDRYKLPPNHAARHHAEICTKGITAIAATCKAAIGAGVTPLEISAIIELALREAYPDQPLPKR